MQSRFIKEQRSHEKARFETGVGWRYGLILGMLLVTFGWGWDAWELASASANLWLAKLVLASLIIVPLTVAAGLFGSLAHDSALLKWLIWTAWSILVTIVAIHLPFDGMRMMAGLLDPAVRGLAVFPFTPGAQALGEFLMFIGAVIGFPAAMLHILATEKAWDRSGPTNQLTPGSWVYLLVCLPLGLGLAFLCDTMVNSTLREPFQVTYRVIEVALTTPPDLESGSMSPSQMMEYQAGLQWREKLSPRFIQDLSDYDPDSFQQLTIDVTFDNGTILRCGTTHYGQAISGCYDLSTNYRDALAGFLQTGTASCKDCSMQVAAQAAAWQAARKGQFGDLQQISILHHAGSIVTGLVDLTQGRVECRFEGGNPVVIQTCSIGN
jgi:hypothetical protein